MKVLVQWARQVPQGWEELDSKTWHQSPAKPDRTGRPVGEGVDHQPGYVAALNVQGVTFYSDHYHVEHIDDETIKVTVWEDDPTHGPKSKRAMVWTFKTLALDMAMGGIYNTRQTKEIFAEENARLRMVRGGWTNVRPWSEFAPPPATATRHGRMLSDELWDKHVSATGKVGWREWTEGVPAEDVVDGRVAWRPKAR